MMEWVGVGVLIAALLGVALWWFSGRRRVLPGKDVTALPEPSGVGGLFADALRRTREAVGASLRAVFARESMDEPAWQALEEALLRADVGARTSLALVEELRKGSPGETAPGALQARLAKLIEARIGAGNHALATTDAGPLVILVVGVNGSGKTTTIGKLAARYKREGRTVMLAAGDTFRAGAIEQLKVWAERVGVPVVAHQEGGDPAAVCHDALQSAIAKGIDVVICDTAGRLQAHSGLMDELAKVRRVITRLRPGAPHETLLVLDGTMGQNALSQARIFGEVAGVTGIVLTKLDGTAKGGVVVAIHDELKLPVKLVGMGEKVDDLRDFDPRAFAAALFGGGV